MLHLDPIQLPDTTTEVGDGARSYANLALSIRSRGSDFGTPGVPERCHLIDGIVQAERFHYTKRT